jgi:hypothetical protein
MLFPFACDLISIHDLLMMGKIELSTGDEIGRMAYETGDIPFICTSGLSNWEIGCDARQGVSQDIYGQYSQREDAQALNILLVRDETCLVGSSCLVTEEDSKIL